MVDNESPVIIIPRDEEYSKDKKMLLITRKYEDVNKNEVNFAGKITIEAKSRGIRKNLTVPATEQEEVELLLGMTLIGRYETLRVRKPTD